MIETEKQRRWWFATHPEFSGRHAAQETGKCYGNTDWRSQARTGSNPDERYGEITLMKRAEATGWHEEEDLHLARPERTGPAKDFQTYYGWAMRLGLKDEHIADIWHQIEKELIDVSAIDWNDPRSSPESFYNYLLVRGATRPQAEQNRWHLEYLEVARGVIDLVGRFVPRLPRLPRGPWEAVWRQKEWSLARDGRYTDVKGRTVLQRDHIFDPYGPHKPAGINLNWMKVGIATTGKDGYPVELHHMYQKDRGPLVEVLKSEHKGHLHGRKPRLGNKLTDATFRMMYWQDRAKRIEER